MTYVAWVSTEGGGPPSGELTWYFGDHPAGGTMPGSSNPATVARDDFVARLAETITWEDWEGEGPYGPWEAGTSLDGVEIVRNGVTADFAGTASAVVAGENSGRFNVDPPGFISELFCETQLRNETGDVREFVMNFAPPIVAWGAFLTDLGDFSGSPISIEITKFGGGTESYELTPGGELDGMLHFIGFVDDSGATYTSIRIHVVDANTGAADGVGLDDIYWCDASGLA